MDDLMRELYINLSKEEIHNIEDECRILRLRYPGDKSLSVVNYKELCSTVGKCDVSSYYGSYLLLRLSVQDVLNRVDPDHQCAILESILTDAELNDNILGCEYITKIICYCGKWEPVHQGRLMTPDCVTKSVELDTAG
jgi:hypothetical protein